MDTFNIDTINSLYYINMKKYLKKKRKKKKKLITHNHFY